MKSPSTSLVLLVFCLLPGDSEHPSSRFRAVSVPVGKGPRWITVADVNHDSIPDILVASSDSETISVFLGDGEGNFRPSPGSPFPAGHLPNDIAVADMNGDGNPDLVIANHQSPYVRVLLGDGRGGFRLAPGSPIDVHSNPHPHAVVAADFNGDGKPDVATDSWAANQVELLLGDGRGGLISPGHYFAVGRRPYERLRTADFNRDGTPDLVTTNLDDGTVTTLLGDGKGGFRNAPGSPFPAGAKPWQIAIADINGDGIADLVVIPYQADLPSPKDNVVTVLLGDGHGSFHAAPEAPLSLDGCEGPNSVSVGDLRGDGLPTIAVSCSQSRTLSLFDRQREGSYTASSFPIKGGWGAVAIARLTHDRRSEIITADTDASTITIYSSN